MADFRIFRPSGPDTPGWLSMFADSIEGLFRRIMPAPLRLKDYATADLPTAADFAQGMAYNSTTLRVTYSNASAWVDLMPYTAGAALTRTNDTNVTVTLGGSPTNALLAATSLTLGWTGTLATGRGGTGVSSLGDITRTNDTNVTLTLGGTPTGALITSTSFTLGWTGTLAAGRGGTGVSSLGDLTKTDDTNVTLTLGGTPTGSLIKSASITVGWTGTLSVARGGSGAGTLTGLLVGNGTSAFTTIAPGTGVATALAVNVGSAGAFVTFNGALGTPSSGSAANLTSFPTLNQNTTGSAAKWTTARNLAGNSVDGSANVAFANKFIVQGTADTGLSAAQFLGALGTGIVKNTTTTGVLSIAVAGDFPTLNQNTTGSAATLTTARTIAGNSFDGSANISINDTDLSGSAWTTYTPTLTPGSGSFTTTSAAGASKKIGKTVFFRMKITITTAGTAASYINASLPFTPANVSSDQSASGYEEALSNNVAVTGKINNNLALITIFKYDGTSIIASGAVVSISGCYEST